MKAILAIAVILMSVNVAQAAKCEGLLKSVETKAFGGQVKAIDWKSEITVEEGMITVVVNDNTYSGKFTNNTFKIRTDDEKVDLILKDIAKDEEQEVNGEYIVDTEIRSYNSGMKLVSKTTGLLRCQE